MNGTYFDDTLAVKVFSKDFLRNRITELEDKLNNYDKEGPICLSTLQKNIMLNQALLKVLEGKASVEKAIF